MGGAQRTGFALVTHKSTNTAHPHHQYPLISTYDSLRTGSALVPHCWVIPALVTHWLRTKLPKMWKTKRSETWLDCLSGFPHWLRTGSAPLDNPPHWFRTTDSSAKYRSQKKICALVLRTGTSAEIHNCALTTSLRTGYALVSAWVWYIYICVIYIYIYIFIFMQKYVYRSTLVYHESAKA